MERLFDPSSTRQIAFLLRHHSFVVISSGDSIFIGLNELGNHIPEQLHFSRRFNRHRWSKISEVVIRLLNLILDLFHNLRKRKLDVGEQNLRKL